MAAHRESRIQIAKDGPGEIGIEMEEEEPLLGEVFRGNRCGL